MIVIDRFTEQIAVLETDNGHMEISRALLPKEAAEGDLLIFANGQYVVDKEGTKQRRAEILDKMKKLGLR